MPVSSCYKRRTWHCIGLSAGLDTCTTRRRGAHGCVALRRSADELRAPRHDLRAARLLIRPVHVWHRRRSGAICHEALGRRHAPRQQSPRGASAGGASARATAARVLHRWVLAGTCGGVCCAQCVAFVTAAVVAYQPKQLQSRPGGHMMLVSPASSTCRQQPQ